MKIDNPRKYTAKLLNDVFMGKNGEIVSMKPIHRGYTNFSYIVLFENGKKYQVRLPHCGSLINRKNEYTILSLLDDKNFIYFDTKTGIAVKKWIEGKNPKISAWRQWKQVDQLFSTIKKIHSLNIPADAKFKKIDYDSYNDNLYRLKLSYQTKYLSIVDQIRTEPVVINHTDINRENIVVGDDGKLHIIDYEWTGLANDYWDYANFIRESRILWYPNVDWKKYINNFDMRKLKEFIFVSSVFAYLWTWKMEQTPRIKKYRKRTLRQVRYYGRGIINNNNEE